MTEEPRPFPPTPALEYHSGSGPREIGLRRPAGGRPERTTVVKVPPGLAATPTALDLLRALRRRWPLAVGSALALTGLVVGLAWLLLPPSKYTARALLRVYAKVPYWVLPTQETQVETRDEVESYKQTQVDLIKSALVLNAALRDPKIASLEILKKQPDPIEWLNEELQIGFTNGSEVLQIALRGDRPGDVALLVNAITQAYLREIVDKVKAQRVARYDKLQAIYTRFQEGLKAKRETVNALSKATGSTDKTTIAFKQQLAIDQHAQAVKDLQQLRWDLRRLKAEADVLRRAPAPKVAQFVVDEVPINEALQHDLRYQELVKELHRHQAQLSQNQRLIRNNADPVLRHYRDLVSRAQRAFDEYVREFKDTARLVQKGKATAEKGGELAQLERRLAVLADLEQQMEKEAKRLEEGTQALNQNTIDLQTMIDEITEAQQAASKVGAELKALDVELDAPSRVELIQTAPTPRRKEDKRPLMASMAGACAFMFALLSVSWWEFQARRIASTDEVVHGLGLRLVGALPDVPERSRRKLSGPVPEADPYWSSLLVESIDATRTMLLHAAGGEPIRALMVTSAASGEGKTSLASQLANSLARAGRRTLLVDCDLRNPVVHKLFDQLRGPGFCELLRGEAELSDVIQSTFIPGLSLIAAGECDAQALQVLAREQVGDIFQTLKNEFDFVVIDTAPVLPVADSLLVARHADAVLFSILRDVSRAHCVYTAYERLSTLGVRMLGAVVTGAREEYRNSSYRYPYPQTARARD
jgi:capsular exopolysaccharide synthesis family protein